MPYSETLFEYGAVRCRGHLMSGQREVLPDRAEAREKRLREIHIAKAAHLAFSLAGRLVAVLGTVVHACSRFDENVLHMRELGNVSLRCRIAAQLVGNDSSRHGVRTQHPAEEALWRTINLTEPPIASLEWRLS